MSTLKSNHWLALSFYLALPIASAGTVQIELAPSYVATREKNGDIEIVVTVSTNRHMSNNGAVATSVPMSSFLDQAANRECPHGYEVKSHDLPKSQALLNVINWTQRTVIRCHGA